MFKVFNMGIGMVLIVDQQSVDSTQTIIDATGLSSIQIGTVKANGTGSVRSFKADGNHLCKRENIKR